MRLETKLGCGTAVLITAMFGIALVGAVRIQAGNRLAHSVMSDRLPLILEIRNMRAHISSSIRAQESYMLFGTSEVAAAPFRMQRAQDMARAQQALSAVDNSHAADTLGEDAARLDMIRDGLARLKLLEDRVEELNETHTPDNIAEAYVLMQRDVLPLEESVYQAVNAVSESQSRQAAQDAERLQRDNRLTLITLWLTTIGGALAGGTFKVMLSRNIAKTLDLIADRANCIASGDLTGAELGYAGHDQLGTLAHAMNRMQTALGSIIGTVADTAGSLTGSAASMRSASDGIHRRIDQQSQQTQQAATAMQEMSASIAEVSRHTHSAAETARSAAQTAREGGTIVKQMLGAMHSIATAVSDTSSTVGLLGEDSRRISQIVTVIDEIARKTNLLALNAAIEAARAGDQGRGFAVVAGEVRRLAESTAQATGEIGAMIHEIQERTRTAIASMQSGTSTVQEGVVTTTQAGEALERIIGMAERVDRMITQIAIAASQQATAADQSSASLDSIHNLSHDNLTEMATTAAGIESLRGTAVTLEKHVDRFRLTPVNA